MEESKAGELCSICGIPLNKGCVVHNVPENCKEHITFPYMRIGDRLHIECYIQHVIEVILMEKVAKLLNEENVSEISHGI